MRLACPLFLLVYTGCATAAVGDAVVNTAIGVGAAAVRRAHGECYTPCTPGTACNPETGMCDTLPCRGTCAFNEKCLSTYKGDSCVPAVEGPTPSAP